MVDGDSILGGGGSVIYTIPRMQNCIYLPLKQCNELSRDHRGSIG